MSMPLAAKSRIPGESLDDGRGAAACVVPFQRFLPFREARPV